jgi:hypothetical protein
MREIIKITAVGILVILISATGIALSTYTMGREAGRELGKRGADRWYAEHPSQMPTIYIDADRSPYGIMWLKCDSELQHPTTYTYGHDFDRGEQRRVVIMEFAPCKSKDK